MEKEDTTSSLNADNDRGESRSHSQGAFYNGPAFTQYFVLFTLLLAVEKSCCHDGQLIDADEKVTDDEGSSGESSSPRGKEETSYQDYQPVRCCMRARHPGCRKHGCSSKASP